MNTHAEVDQEFIYVKIVFMCAGNLVPRNDEKELLVDPQVQSSNPLQDDDIQRMLDRMVSTEMGYALGAAMNTGEQVRFGLAAKFLGTDTASATDGTVDFESATFDPSDGQRAREVALTTAAGLTNASSGTDSESGVRPKSDTYAYVVEFGEGQRVVLGLCAEVPEDVQQWGLEHYLGARLTQVLNSRLASSATTDTGVVASGG